MVLWPSGPKFCYFPWAFRICIPFQLHNKHRTDFGGQIVSSHRQKLHERFLLKEKDVKIKFSLTTSEKGRNTRVILKKMGYVRP